ncbi:HD domain-containing protein [Streptomyces filipinensis]|uniref:HD domain-containing protein n=1 Tax=Streptomyces filipinensis TaxID=66887 RepID=UPI00178129AB
MRSGRRRALLIAVPAHPDLEKVPELRDAYPSLPFTVTDVANLRDALLRSGYAAEDVTVLDDEETITQRNIRGQLDEFLASCEDGDVGLVYFSGHGVRFGETDYLVPGDIWARRRPGGEHVLDTHGLIEVVPDELLQSLTSDATVMLCLDACRGDGGEVPAGLEKLTFSRARDNVVILSACAPGETALGHDQGGSFMARALTQAVAREAPARTVGDVIRAVQDRVPDIARRYSYLKPPAVDVLWLGKDQSGGAHAAVPLCEAMPFAGPWTQAVLSSALWGLTEASEAEQAKAKEQLADVVTKVLRVRESRRAGTDPWDDDLFPERLINRLGHLVVASDARLGPVETVVLLGAPFLREAALACGLAALRNVIGDGGPEDTADARDLPAGCFEAQLDRDMGDVRRAHRQAESWRETLLRRDRAEDARGAEYWLRHRFLADWDLLWESGEDAQLDSLRSAVDLLVRAAESATGEQLGHDDRATLRRAVLQVVSQLGTGTPAEAAAPDGSEWVTGLSEELCGEERWTWRPRELATLLHIAGLLAIDPRMLDGVLIDHLGPREPTQIRPQGIVGEIRANKGFGISCDAESPEAAASGTRWLLVFKCGSAALYTALDRLAVRIAAVSQAARRTHGTLRPSDLLFGLPQVVKTDGLLPKNRAFDKPPPRFQLAEDEVKPLIMGTQLYGDRMLAVRELYQNALDACRVRQARRRYADCDRWAGSEPEQVQLAGSKIEFTQGVDEATGRMYIQCEDNGVGMTAEELRDLFAQAGRRSEQSSARMREMRRWRRKGITTELNSRFGIGVFSYFMLAEEVEVITRPVGMSGGATAPDGGYRASVTAGSGLMHLSREEKELEGGGTRVRLYVHDEPDGQSGRQPSVIQALRGFLWCSPVKVTATEFEGEPVVWRQGELYGDSRLPTRHFQAAEDIWWVDGAGLLLADGLFVEEVDRPFGYVVNLRGRHRPKLSVDRNRILGYDKERLQDDLQDVVPELVRSAWSPFPLEWLWELTKNQPLLGQMVVGHLLESDVPLALPEGLDWKSRAQIQGHRTLRDVGCFPVDQGVRNGSRRRGKGRTDLFTAWRESALGIIRSERPLEKRASLPAIQPFDALVFRTHPDGSWGAALRAAADSGSSLREAVRQLRRYAIAGVPVPEMTDVRALDEVVPDHLTADLYETYRDAERRGYEGQLGLRTALVRVSDMRQVSLCALVEACGRLSRLEPSIQAPMDLQALGSHVVGARERHVLLDDEAGPPSTSPPLAVDGEPPFAQLMRPFDIAWRSRQSGVPAAEIEAVVRRFEPLGFRLTGPDLVHSLDRAQFAAVSRNLDGDRYPLAPGPIGLRHLVRLAARRAETVGDSVRWLSGWAGELGFQVPDPGSLADFRPPAWCEALPPEQTADNEGGPSGARPLSAWAVLRALGDLDEPSSLAENVAAIETLVDAGLVERPAVDAARAWLSTSQPGRPREIMENTWVMPVTDSGPLSRVLSPSVTRRDRVDPVYLMGLAASSNTRLGDLAERLRRRLAVYGLEVCDVPEEAARQRPSPWVFTALSHRGEWRRHIWLADLIFLADREMVDLATAAATVNAYRSLGAPTVPVPDGFAPPDRPQKRDVTAEYALMQPDLEESWTLTPLALVIAAGRLGLALPQAYRRLRQFEAVGLDIPFPEPVLTRTPDWRDVVILTARLTGREPALSGDLTEDQVLLASEETDLTADEVRERLGDYAPLFGFRLPPYEGK